VFRPDSKKLKRAGPGQQSVPSLSFDFPGDNTRPRFFDPPANFTEYELGPNDSSIQRGDREDTGDNEARPDELGSGFAQPTVDPTAFGGTTSISHPTSSDFDPEAEAGDMEGLEIRPATDRSLGLTDIPGVPADDWAADTGPTHTPGEKQ
jgi:hypothetical protein